MCMLHLLLHLGQGGNIAASLLCRALGLGDLISDASQNGRSLAVSVIAMMTRDENLLVNNRLIHRITVWLVVVVVVSIVATVGVCRILTGQTAVRGKVFILRFNLFKGVSRLLSSICCKSN